MNKIKPAYFQGFLAGCVILASRFIVYLSHNWDFTIVPAYMLLTGLVLIVGMVMGITADRKEFEEGQRQLNLSLSEENGLAKAAGEEKVYGYWMAFMSAFRVVAIAILVVVLADMILMLLIDETLINQTKSLKIEQLKLILTTPKIENEKIDEGIAELRKQDYHSVSFWFAEWINKIISNALVGLIIAAFMRRKKQTHWVDQG